MEEKLLFAIGELIGKMARKNMLKPVTSSIGTVFEESTEDWISGKVQNVVKSAVSNASLVGLGSGFLNLIPAVGTTINVAALAGITWKMYYDINQCLGISFSENTCKSIASGVASNLGGTVAGSATTALLGAIPFFGAFISAFGNAIVNRSVLYASAIIYVNILSNWADTGNLDVETIPAYNPQKAQTLGIQSFILALISILCFAYCFNNIDYTSYEREGLFSIQYTAYDYNYLWYFLGISAISCTFGLFLTLGNLADEFGKKYEGWTKFGAIAITMLLIAIAATITYLGYNYCSDHKSGTFTWYCIGLGVIIYAIMGLYILYGLIVNCKITAILPILLIIVALSCYYYCFRHDAYTIHEEEWIFGKYDAHTYNKTWYILGIIALITTYIFCGSFFEQLKYNEDKNENKIGSVVISLILVAICATITYFGFNYCYDNKAGYTWFVIGITTIAAGIGCFKAIGYFFNSLSK